MPLLGGSTALSLAWTLGTGEATESSACFCQQLSDSWKWMSPPLQGQTSVEVAGEALWCLQPALGAASKEGSLRVLAIIRVFLST